MTDLLNELVDLTTTLGEPSRRYVIIGEGNTSAKIDGDTFWVKASGQEMANIAAGGFTSVHFDPILAMLDDLPATRTEQTERMHAAKTDPSMGKPSVEVGFHAMLLHECNVKFVGHTHPNTVVQVMCSSRAEQFAARRMFPDEAVLCGPESVFLPYIDPGFPLAIAMRDAVRDYMGRLGEAPKVILLANHGLIALGNTSSEIIKITEMAVKAAEVFVGACAVGGPVFMDPAEVMHIYRRPDEIYRRNMFVE